MSAAQELDALAADVELAMAVPVTEATVNGLTRRFGEILNCYPDARTDPDLRPRVVGIVNAVIHGKFEVVGPTPELEKWLETIARGLRKAEGKE